MILLRLNGIDVDVDEKTAIGIDFQTYDVKEPGKRKINTSNNFTIPATSNNLKIIGFANDPQFTSNEIYDTLLCEYWIDNEKFIDNAKTRVTEVGERISLFIFQKDDVWDDLKEYLWPDFVEEFLDWLIEEKSLPDSSSPYIGTYQNFLLQYNNSTEGLILPMYFGNLYNEVFNDIGDTKTFAFTESQTTFSFTADFTYKLTNWDSGGSNNVASVEINGGTPSYPFLIEKGDIVSFEITKTTGTESAELSFFGENVYLEDITNIWLKYYPQELSEAKNGGHFCAFVKTIFEFLESKYEVNFGVSEVGLYGNIWDDAYAEAIYVPVRDIDVLFHYTGGGAIDGYYFEMKSSGTFAPEEDLQDKPDKSMYDFVTAFFQHFNIIKDEIYQEDGTKIIRLARFDNINASGATVVNFSGKLKGIPKFKPFVEGYAQKNYIKFGSIYEGGSQYQNARIVTCLNKNLDKQNDSFITIDSHIPAFVAITGGVVPDLSTTQSFETFEFFINGGDTTDGIVVNISHDSDTVQTTITLKKAALYSLAGEYVVLNSIMSRPRFYTIEKWLTLEDIRNLEFLKQYFIRELNGSFYINKISGFNPGRSNEPTTLEVIKVSDKVALETIELEYYVDGIDNIFTDGEGNNFF